MSQPSFAFSKPLAAKCEGEPCAVLAYAESGTPETDGVSDWLLIVVTSGRMVWMPMSEVTIRDAETVFIG